MRINKVASVAAIALAGLLLLSSCSPEKSAPPEAPAGWVQFTASNAFTFYGPSDLKEIPVQGIDSLVGQYKSSGIELYFDYGYYSSTLEEWASMPGYIRTNTNAGGRSAELVSTKDKIGIVIPKVKGNIKLTMWADCSNDTALETAKKLLQTIQFQ